MTKAFTRDDLKELVAHQQAPCVSLYLPTRHGADDVTPIRWKKLLRRAEEYLEKLGLAEFAARNLLRPAWDLLENPSFCTKQGNGLALFLTPGFVRSCCLPTQPPELVSVGSRFHLKPLLPVVTDNRRFYVLAISQKKVRLLRGTAYSVEEVDPQGVPRSLAEALQFDHKEEPLLFHTHPALGYGRWSAIFHGHGVGIDDHKDDLLRYFQQVDRGLHELLREERTPLVIAAVEYLWPIYRDANRYPHLLETGIPGNPDHLSVKELHDRAWALVAPRFSEVRQEAKCLYRQLAGTGRASNDLEAVVRAAHEGQVEALFVADDREKWGTFDAAEGKLSIHEREEPGDEDLLDRAAVDTFLHGGSVYVVHLDQMPDQSLVAALLRLASTRKTGR